MWAVVIIIIIITIIIIIVIETNSLKMPKHTKKNGPQKVSDVIYLFYASFFSEFLDI